jgi:hypothetical protein
MTIPQDLKTLINSRINEKLESVGSFRTAELVMEIITSWSSPLGPDEDKWRHCAYVAMTKAVADATRRFVVQEDDDHEQLQTAFEGLGFTKIRPAYQIEGETVRADRMTVAQAMKVIDELRRVQRGVELHVHELLRFIDEVLIPSGNGN